MNPFRTFLFFSLAACSLGCERRVALEQFKRLETYKTSYIELNVPMGLFPIKENESLYRNLFGSTPQGKASFEIFLHNSGGHFLDPKGMVEGRNRIVIFTANRAENGCADRMKRIADAAPAIGGAKAEIIAGKKFETFYSSADHTLEFHRCERDIYWFLVFQDSKAPDQLALLAWAKPSVESAK